jgi:protein-L-isoaspartate(D-aspartate) O-methyltransferase
MRYDDYSAARRNMVEAQLEARGITDRRVLEAMQLVPRHEFVVPDHRTRAYSDEALPIGHRQTISQPYIVALMAQAARVMPTDRVLDVGTGSGYAAAVLSRLAAEVYSIELHAELAAEAADRLAKLGYTNVHVSVGDGHHGLPELAPFDVVIVSAAADATPPALLAQLAPGGRLIIPLETALGHQELFCEEKAPDGELRKLPLGPVAFVPLLIARG